MRCIVLFHNGQTKAMTLTGAEELREISDRINNGNAVLIGGSVYHGWEIRRVMNEEDYQEWYAFEREKRMQKERLQLFKLDQWMCRFGYWHSRHEECGHNLQYGGQESTREEFLKKARSGEYDYLIQSGTQKLPDNT